jgi:hypothetical protein
MSEMGEGDFEYEYEDKICSLTSFCREIREKPHGY